MVTRYAFYFDSASCSGCKACQMACKDKHDLEVGRRWRRVYEISGGGWTAAGKAWKHRVFAYHLSIACNHCEKPICVEVCPTRAMHQRTDGIVLVDQGKCIGCRYCAWACPYSAPQRDEAVGKMSKCHFCHDELDQGRPPACVAACPMRVLDFGDLDELRKRHGGASDDDGTLRHGVAPGDGDTPPYSVAPGDGDTPDDGEAPTVFPLPDPALTGPRLVLSPHPSAAQADSGTARVANQEEV